MPFCANCGRENPAHAAFCQGCGATVNAGNATGRYGGFWKRALAWLIDSVIVGAGAGLLVAITFGGAFPLIFLAHWLYEAFMLSSSWRATVGKRALNLTVVGPGELRFPLPARPAATSQNGCRPWRCAPASSLRLSRKRNRRCTTSSPKHWFSITADCAL